MTLFFIILFGIYAVLVLLLIAGWSRTMHRSYPAGLLQDGISVVVAVRNEEASLGMLIASYKNCEYAPEHTELIIVNDHSIDNSYAAFEKCAEGVQRIRWIDAKGEGKKAAIAEGLAQVRFNIIATTDADCIIPVTWLKEIGERMSDGTLKMLVGPVRIAGHGFLAGLQSTEFCSLMGTAGATLGFGIPSLSNGANLVYRKSCFLEVDGYQGNGGFSSGDDEFLMRKFHARWPGQIGFINTSAGVVTTASHRTIPGFIRQRLRWAGKWRPDFRVLSTWVALMVWLIHACFIAFAITAVSGKHDTWIVGVLLLSKLIVEALFLYPVSLFLRARWSWVSFFLLQLIYSFYVVLTGFLSFFVVVKWKGRVVTAKA